MTSLKTTLDMITPGLCGGASPNELAEIRAPSIRGQLRWCFRALGGFKSQTGTPLREQEADIFGACAGDSGQASKLQVRVRATAGSTITSTVAKMADDLGAGMNTEKGYILFPLRQQKRALFEKNLPSFELHLNWRGPVAMAEDIKALATVFVHLGSLGFRSRRAMGALAFAAGQQSPMSLKDALARFAKPDAITVRQLPAKDADDAIRTLAAWLKSWRMHGRTEDHQRNGKPTNAGFKYAKNDHDMGCGQNPQGKAFRAAIGLPIIQRYSRGGTSNWEESQKLGGGRFASPVILRPHRDAQGGWHALVLFIEAHKWPEGKTVYLNGQPKQVSLDLYNAMKADTKLQAIP